MSSVAGVFIRDALGAYPEKPEVPPYVYVDPAEQQRRAIRGNRAALSEETLLAQQTNLANLQDTQALFRKAFPNYEALAGESENALLSYLRGELPEGTRRAIGSRAAAGGLMGAPGGSGSIYDLYSGLEADQNVRYAIGATQGYLRGNPILAATPRYAIGQSFLSPQFYYGAERSQQDDIWNRNFAANKLAAIPDAKNVALGEAVGGIFDTVEMLGKSYVTGGLGGLAGGMAGGGIGGGAGQMGAGQAFSQGGFNSLAGMGGSGGGGFDINSLLQMLGGSRNNQAPSYNPQSFYGSPPYGF